jgi:putative transposase
MPTLTIKIPLFEPTKIKHEMYRNMSSIFSEACNLAIQIKRDHASFKASDIDKMIGHFHLPTTLIQEARKLAVSRFDDWKKHQKTKGFPSFRKNIYSF